jgi:hypothetical protein
MYGGTEGTPIAKLEFKQENIVNRIAKYINYKF